MIHRPAWICSGHWSTKITALTCFLFISQMSFFSRSLLFSDAHLSSEASSLFTSSAHLFSPFCLSKCCLFSLPLRFFHLFWLVCFHVFFHPHHHAGLWLCGVMRPRPVSSGTPPAVGGSLWSLGLGSAPPGPPAPGRLHRSISWAGTVHHMCAPTPPPLQKTPGVVYFFSLAQYGGLPAQTGSDIWSSQDFYYIPSIGKESRTLPLTFSSVSSEDSNIVFPIENKE